MLILVLGVYIYFELLMAKYEYNYVSVLDFCTSPYYISNKLSRGDCCNNFFDYLFPFSIR